MSADDVDPGRVAELLVSTVQGRQRRGSGYRVNARVVLTAAHVVQDAASVVVRFEGGTERERRAQGEQILVAGGDLAGVLLPAGWADEVVEAAQVGPLGERGGVGGGRGRGGRFSLVQAPHR